MNLRSLLLVMTLLAPAVALAQSTNANSNASGTNGTSAKAPAVPTGPIAGLDEADRLMQEYMARRAEWMAVRKAAVDQAAKAPNAEAGKAIIKQLETDEKPYLAKMADAGKAYSDAKKQKHPAVKPRG